MPALDSYYYNQDREFATELMRELTPRQKQVIALRFGFLNNKPKTAAAVAKHLKISRQTVRDIETAAMSRLRAIAID